MKRVLYRSPFIPAEWIAAHGFEPVRLIPSSASTDGPVPDAEGVCPFMRGFINEASSSSANAIVDIFDANRSAEFSHYSVKITFNLFPLFQ